MSAIKQYIDLYDECGNLINAGSNAVMNAKRDAALNALRGKELPSKGDEDYEYTDFNAIFSPDYGLNINRLDMEADPAEPFRCDVPNMSTNLYFTYNDMFHRSSTAAALPNGVVVEPFSEAAAKHRDIIEKHYAALASLDDTHVALNTLLAQDGILVYFAPGCHAEKPVQIVNLLNSQSPLMANRRVLVVVGDGASGKILVCDHTQAAGTAFLNSQVIEAHVGENASLDFYDLEESSHHTSRVSSMWVKQEKGSSVLINNMTLTNGTTRNNFSILLDGENAETRLLGMAISSGSQHVDNHTFIAHNKGYCHSNELFKYVLDDNATGAFTGKILVAPNAPKTEAYQSNRNICASAQAKMHTKPQLEIYTDDVKCSHGATVGQLDQDALFYMQTRGISCKEARTMLMQAFMNDVIDGIRLDALRDRLRHLVEKRFAGTLAQCRDCSASQSCHSKIKKS